MSIELKRMTPSRAAYFMERFKREEKLFGPNEQAALTYVINMLEKATAIQQAEAQQPATPEPVGFTYQAEIDYANSTGGNGSFWRVPPDLDDEAVPLYAHPAPSVPGDVVRDAERYRWLRDHDHWPAPFSSSQEPEPVRGRDLDSNIDAAMLAAK